MPCRTTSSPEAARPARLTARRGARLSGRGQEAGYVLVTALMALALLALVAARLDERVASVLDATDRWGRWHQADRDIADAHEQLMFSLATRQVWAMGFGSGPELIRVDGRPYSLPSGVHVSVQDARGLISVATAETSVMRSFLLLQGVNDREVDGLLDKLADYSDQDSLRRLNGGEAPDYGAAGLPPPRNDWPLSAHELQTVLGWHQRPALWQAAADNFTAVRDGWLNPNTAPLEVLRALPGASDEAVRNLMQLREQRHLGSAAEVAAVSGILMPDNAPAFYPGLFYRLRLWRPGSPGAVEYTVMLSPDAPTMPWTTLEVRHIPPPKLPLNTPYVSPFPLAMAPPDAAPAHIETQ